MCLATSPKSLSNKNACTFQSALAWIMMKILFCLATEYVYGTDC